MAAKKVTKTRKPARKASRMKKPNILNVLDENARKVVTLTGKLRLANQEIEIKDRHLKTMTEDRDRLRVEAREQKKQARDAQAQFDAACKKIGRLVLAGDFKCVTPKFWEFAQTAMDESIDQARKDMGQWRVASFELNVDEGKKSA